MMQPVLHTDRLILRPPVADDLAGFTAYRMSDRARHSGGPSSDVEAWQLFAMIMGHWQLLGFGLWTVTLKDGRAIGSVGCLFPAGWPEREIGWHIWNAADEGKGYAFEAANAALDHAFGALGWESAASFIAPANTASRALAERLGARIDPHRKGLAPDDLVFVHPRRGQA